MENNPEIEEKPPEIPLAPLKRKIQQVTVTGRKPRIGERALKSFRLLVERYAEDLATESAKQAAKRGKTTIDGLDIYVANMRVWEGKNEV
jgi:histone H3/H4